MKYNDSMPCVTDFSECSLECIGLNGGLQEDAVGWADQHSMAITYHLREPKYLRTPMALYLPQGPLGPRSAAPRLRSRAPSRSKRKCWVQRSSNPLPM